MPIKFLKTIYINLCAMRIRLQKNRRFLSDFSHFHEKGRAKARCFGKNNAKTGTPETCIQQKREAQGTPGKRRTNRTLSGKRGKRIWVRYPIVICGERRLALQKRAYRRRAQKSDACPH